MARLTRAVWDRQTHRNRAHILAFDPGGVTGWCQLILDYRAFTRPHNRALEWLWSWDSGELKGTEFDNYHYPFAKAEIVLQELV